MHPIATRHALYHATQTILPNFPTLTEFPNLVQQNETICNKSEPVTTENPNTTLAQTSRMIELAAESPESRPARHARTCCATVSGNAGLPATADQTLPSTFALEPDDPRLHDLSALNARQLHAVDLCALGHSDAEVAAAVGVARATIYRWRRFHPAFLAELSQRRADLHEHTADQLRNMLAKATQNVGALLDADDPKIRDRASLLILQRFAPRTLEPGPAKKTSDFVHAHIQAQLNRPNIASETLNNAHVEMLTRADPQFIAACRQIIAAREAADPPAAL